MVTESDYDRFLDSYPLLATFLANLLITKTAVMIGYSLDDPDFRQVWQIVSERLGRSRRIAYAITIGSKPTDISRFERRGVKVINLPKEKGTKAMCYRKHLQNFVNFGLRIFFPQVKLRKNNPFRELSLPKEAQTRLCFFSVPLSVLSFYRDRIFPFVGDHGFVPVTANDIVTPGDAILTKILFQLGKKVFCKFRVRIDN
ncbi:MAG: SIR2 family protein [Methanomicrobiales archaeon]|nr:SIR2 family protein [Methanomicrobiales archaeon]